MTTPGEHNAPYAPIAKTHPCAPQAEHRPGLRDIFCALWWHEAAAPTSLTQTEGVQTASHHLPDLRSLKGRRQLRRKPHELSRPDPSCLLYQEHAGTHSAEQACAPQGAARAGSAAFQEPGHIPAPPQHTQPSHAAAQKGWAPLSCTKLRAAFRPATCSRSAASPSRGKPNASPCVEGKGRAHKPRGRIGALL